MVVGRGSPDHILKPTEVFELCTEALEGRNLGGKKILCILPDATRSGPVDLMFRAVWSALGKTTNRLDFMMALGTHPPMAEEAICRRVGIDETLRRTLYSRSSFFNHDWQDRDQLIVIGTLDRDEISLLSEGRLYDSVCVTINKKVFEYDVLLIVGPTFPHEVVGFSGGNKYLFPGIAGEEIIHLFHWLGALITSPAIIGVKDTPVRRVIDRSAALLPMERLCLSMVVKADGLAGLYIGTPEEAWSKAADLSEKVHVLFKDHPYKSVLSCAPPMYDDLWTGAKCMYKLEPVVADHGELIIFAPHIREVSVTHGTEIEKVGYHVRDYFLKQRDRFRDVSGCVKAHSTHVRGTGTYVDGRENPRIRVILATRIPESVCRRINLGYLDPDSIDPETWKSREDEGFLLVPKAGEMLYRLKNDPFRNPRS